MEEKNTVNNRERTTIRADLDARERINRMAEQMGMSQEKFVGWMAEQTEKSLQNSVDNDVRDVDNDSNVVDKKQEDADITHYDLLLEIKSVKRVVYRIVKELCRITDADVKDLDSGISIQTKYDDRLLHPEKYRKRYKSSYGKGK